MALQGRRVLVVRPRLLPEWGADQFVEQLCAAGAEPLHYPVIAITPFAVSDTDSSASPELEAIKDRVMAFGDYHAAVFVSRVAAYLGADWIDRYWPQWPASIRCYAVGGSTARVLADKGLNAITPDTDMSSEGLLALPEFNSVNGQKVLIFRGCGGRELLADTLRKRGAEVHYAQLYRRKAFNGHQQQIVNLLEAGIDALALHSGEMLQALMDLLPPPQLQQLMAVPVLVPGQRLASLAGRAGFQRIVVSPDALPQNMVSTLSRWYINANG